MYKAFRHRLIIRNVCLYIAAPSELLYRCINFSLKHYHLHGVTITVDSS